MLDNSASHAPATGQRQLLLLPLLLLIALDSSCCHAADGFSVAHLLREGKHKLCGQALNDAMDVVCVNGYNTIPKKRLDSPPEMAIDADQLQLRPGAGYALSPLLSSIYGTEVLIKTRRLRRQAGGGIYDECCRNACTYPELLAYCRR
ncbi:probable insulin-like peptide 1 [Drosophila virilis]|uniref:probable insulin-like peptide 1 n=1 Tax=Drosophila virilis TaxID=7244 RepID=UPI001395DAD9|nr:probable insulin-like peptide 1 [Drosophila virilis]